MSLFQRYLQLYLQTLILFLSTGLCVSSWNDANKPVHRSALPLLWCTDFREFRVRPSHHTSQRTTMDSSQLCTCPAVRLPGRGRRYHLITKQKLTSVTGGGLLPSLWFNPRESAGLCFADVNIFRLACLSLLIGLSARFAFYTFSGMLASGKQLSNGKNKIKKYHTWKTLSSTSLCRTLFSCSHVTVAYYSLSAADYWLVTMTRLWPLLVHWVEHNFTSHICWLYLLSSTLFVETALINPLQAACPAPSSR